MSQGKNPDSQQPGSNINPPLFDENGNPMFDEFGNPKPGVRVHLVKRVTKVRKKKGEKEVAQAEITSTGRELIEEEAVDVTGFMKNLEDDSEG